MRVDEFDYDLPRDMIAQHPRGERANSRLLVYDRTGDRVTHRNCFSDIVEYLRRGDVLVVNDSKVFPARLKVRKLTGGEFDILLVRRLGDGIWECLARLTSKSGHVKVTIGDYTAELTRTDHSLVVSFGSDEAVGEIIRKFGRMPLPPYIKRNGEDKVEDIERYQTVYADNVGSIAAPTAGFHFSNELLSRIRSLDIDIVKITLHVGIGTFSLIRSDTPEEHKMHGEYYELNEQTQSFLKDARDNGRRIVACGTSSVRTLETIFAAGGNARPQGKTELFIYPGYKFRAVDALITNFHLPRSTPLMLVAAFMGTPGLKKTYTEAISEGYRFYSYGDAMFIS